MNQKRKKRIPTAIGETYAFLTARPDGKKIRPGEYCSDCGARTKEKCHRKVGKKYLCNKCLKRSATQSQIISVGEER